MLDTMSKRLPRWIAALGVLAIFWPLPALAQDDQADDGGWTEPATSQNAEPAPEAATPAVNPADADPRALTAFRAQLDASGRWVNDPTYGTVWVPNRAVVGADFAPYVTAGHWALDENGDWIWVSDYAFGNVVFHYGRWVWISGVGWSWVPGYEYAPAWVVWRTPVAGYDYVGWAPAPPAWVWFGGVGVALWMTPPLPYVFCPSVYVFHHHPYAYIVHDSWRAHQIARHTTRYYAPARAGRFGPPLERAHVPARVVPTSRVASRPVPSTPIRSSARGPGIMRARPGTSVPTDARQPGNLATRAAPNAAAAAASRRSGSVAPASAMPANRGTGGYRPPSGTPYRSMSSAPRPYSPAPAVNPSYSRPSATFGSRTLPASRPAPVSSPSRSYPSAASRAASSFRSAPPSSFRSAPAFHSSPAAAPRFSAPSPRGSMGGGFRGAGGGVRGGGRHR